MSLKSSILMCASMAMLAMNDPFYKDPYNELKHTVPVKKKDLPKWKVGDNIIYAKDEKTAMKYAKKRGFWREGMTVELVK